MILDNYKNAAAVVPSDSTDIKARALWVGGGGKIKVLMKDDTAPVTLEGVAAGTLLPITVTRVYATDTTATLIVKLQ